ncbi:ABC transporter substrate-binding protein [Halovivax sp.]|uniref:ABC transporter substrate-binding protein n=1 Tax=Halovivax sp. TaxID=1935978 RepID=UPI0025C592E5|nr:ABC transporter substrate-binding protein [Halovivax sp.]
MNNRERRGSGVSGTAWDDSSDRSPVSGRRDVLRATASGALGVSLAGCTDVFGTAEAAEDGIRIGVLAPDPERSPVGSSIAVTARFVAAQVNATGGLAGRDVEIVVEDTKGSPLEARRAYERLILDEQVDATVGIAESAVLDHLIESIAEHETIHLTTGATSQRVSELVAADLDRYQYHFRTMLNDEQFMQLELSFITEMLPQLGFEAPYELAVLAEGYRWADGVTDAYREVFAEIDGFEIAMAEQYDPEIDDFRALYGSVEEAGADIAWVAMAHTGDAAIVDWQRERPSFGFGGTHVPMQWPGYWDMVDGACEHAISMSPGTPQAEITGETQRFVRAYAEATGGNYPVYTGYTTYDALRMYRQAAENAGTVDPEELVPALEAVEVEATMAETYAFGDESDEYPHDPVWQAGDPDNPGTVYFQWQDDGSGSGAQEIIWPEPYATADYRTPPWLGGA